MSQMNRRDFLRYTAGGSAYVAAGIGEKSVHKLIPYVIPPDNIIPGEWTLFATTCRECPAGCGMVLRHRDGRVVNALGNPGHPVNHGGLCPRGHSAVQGLYDPDRLKRILCARCGREMDEWEGPLEEVATALNRAPRVTIISDIQTDTLLEIMNGFLGAFGSDNRLYLYEPFGYEPIRKANGLLFGIDAIPQVHLDKADTIFSFSADFLESWISPVEYAERFSRMHAYDGEKMGHMTYIGPRFSMTAANADDFLQVPAGTESDIVMAMIKVIVERGWVRRDTEKLKPFLDTIESRNPPVSAERVVALASRFVDSRSSVALAGPVGASDPVAEQLAIAVMLLNYVGGRIDETVDFSQAHALSRVVFRHKLKQVLADLTEDDVLILHNVNLAYCLPETIQDIQRAGTRIYIGTMPDETTRLTPWIFPTNSPLESWGDYEPWTGLHCLMQPTMGRLYGTRSAGDIFLSLAKAAGKPLCRKDSGVVESFEQWLKIRWRDLHAQIAPTLPFEEFWNQSLRTGWAMEPSHNRTTQLNPNATSLNFPKPTESNKDTPETCQVWAWASGLLFDGRVSNRGWLQETADPISGQAWGNCADIHPNKALALGLADADEIEISTKTGRIRLPVRISEDVADNIVAISFGQGHTALGRRAAGRGGNAFELLGEADNNVIFAKATLSKTGKTLAPVFLVRDQQQHNRQLMQWVNLSDLRKMKPGEGDQLILPLPEGYDPKRDLYPPHEHHKHRWAMVIDLARCIGCGACAVACQAENNTAIVGEKPAARWLEMAWLRVIPYRSDQKSQRLGFLPMLCQHCDAAPCESVCPVFASVHNDEGLNAQVYNRCIGTRYCSNNCPYKVRRFNWLNIEWTKPLDLQLNPDVTVRVRGVMEKCTFCVQRIRAAERRAKRERRPVLDGEIQPACLQSCPTRAFTFGDLLDPTSQVSRLTRNDPRRYHVLEELNTKPAITYLRRIHNDHTDV